MLCAYGVNDVVDNHEVTAEYPVVMDKLKGHAVQQATWVMRFIGVKVRVERRVELYANFSGFILLDISIFIIKSGLFVSHRERQ